MSTIIFWVIGVLLGSHWFYTADILFLEKYLLDECIRNTPAFVSSVSFSTLTYCFLEGHFRVTDDSPVHSVWLMHFDKHSSKYLPQNQNRLGAFKINTANSFWHFFSGIVVIILSSLQVHVSTAFSLHNYQPFFYSDAYDTCQLK